MNVNNITCTFNIGCKVSFSFLINKLGNFELKKNFMIIRIRKPKATALLFESGCISMSGLQSVESARKASRRYARLIQKAGYPVRSVKNFVIQNIACSCKVPWRLDIGKLANVLDCRIAYGEGNAAATVIGDGSKRFRFFYTGSIIITGYKDINEMQSEYREYVILVASLIRRNGTSQV